MVQGPATEIDFVPVIVGLLRNFKALVGVIAPQRLMLGYIIFITHNRTGAAHVIAYRAGSIATARLNLV